MSEVYKCDGAVLVMTAEHLLSESENAFIDNFIKYVGAEHLLLVVNKLSAVEDSDVTHVLDYAKKQLAIKFPNVKWTVFDFSEKYNNLIKPYSEIELKVGITNLFEKNQDEEDILIQNTLAYIREQLELQRSEMDDLEGKTKEEKNREKERKEKQKELEKASIESSLIEFQQKRNITVEAIDRYVKKQFDEILSTIEKEFIEAPNKFSWYEKELENRWRKLILSASDKVDVYASTEIEKDIDWLNCLLETKLGISPVDVQFTDCVLHRAGKYRPYGTYKKYAPIGIAGGVAVGYCLLRVVGAVIGLGGGLLAYSYLSLKDSAQNGEMQGQLSSNIRDISLKIRKLSKSEIEKIYANVLSEFTEEAMNIINLKYNFEYEVESDYMQRKQKVDKLIKMLEEV